MTTLNPTVTSTPAADYEPNSPTSSDSFPNCMPVTSATISSSVPAMASKTPLHHPLMLSPPFSIHLSSKLNTAAIKKHSALDVPHTEDLEGSPSIANEVTGDTTLQRRRQTRALAPSTSHPTSSWPDRREMQRRIKAILLGRIDHTQSRKSRLLQRKLSEQWSSTIEECLYKTCRFIEEYADLSTLARRVDTVGVVAAMRRRTAAATAQYRQQSQMISRSNQRRHA